MKKNYTKWDDAEADIIGEVKKYITSPIEVENQKMINTFKQKQHYRDIEFNKKRKKDGMGSSRKR